MNGANGAALAQMRMLDRLFHRQDRQSDGACGTRYSLSAAQRGLITRHRGKPTFDLGHQRIDIDEAVGVEAKARVLEQLGLAHRAA